jgi:hypothetical protein
MDWQRDDIRQVPDPNTINNQQIPHRQEVPSPQQIPGREVFLERPDVPARQHIAYYTILLYGMDTHPSGLHPAT